MKFRILWLVIFLIFFQGQSQLCGGSYGDPIFLENFGSVTSSDQTISSALQPPAYTSYDYVSVFPPNDGDYTIANTTEWTPWSWAKTYDHTADAPGRYGNMLIVNADYDTGEFYRRRVSGLCSNQVYSFTAWILNLHRYGDNVIKPNVTMQIRSITGVVLGSVDTGDIPESSEGRWRDYFLDFVSDGTSTEVDVVLINNSPGGIGNDLVIDDISFRPCGAPAVVTASISNISTSGICDNATDVLLKAGLAGDPFVDTRYIWQRSIDDGLSWENLTAVTSDPTINIAAGTYFNNYKYRFVVGEAANILFSNCQIYSSAITFVIWGQSNRPDVEDINLCQQSGFYRVYSNKTNYLWYTAETGGVGNPTAPIINLSVLAAYDFWVSQVLNGCESERVKLTVTVSAKSNPPVVQNVSVCQNSYLQLSAIGTNLLWYTSSTGGSSSSVAPIVDTSEAGSISYWVSQNPTGCESDRVEIKVTILPAPFSNNLQDVSICDGESYTLDAGNGFVSYVWNTTPPTYSQTLVVSETGTYSVTLTDSNGCQNTQEVNVVAGITPQITSVFSDENAIKIYAEGGNSPYFYSIDGVNWQDSDTFSNLSSGIYTVYVKSQVASCIAQGEVAVINIPNVITPDGDGINDSFTISYLSYFPDAELIVFDRYGKVLYQSKDKNVVWDGTSDGRILPSDTYWYHFDLGNGFQKSGWVVLKNRN